MEPTFFEGANAILKPPEGVDSSECSHLAVCHAITDGGIRLIISAYKLTEAEKKHLLEGGHVYLMIWGSTMPPVCMTVVNPTVPGMGITPLEDRDNGNDQASRGGGMAP